MYRARFLVSREPRWASVVPWHWSYVFGCCSEAGGPSCSVASEKSTDQTTPTDDNAHLDNTTETTSTSDLIHMWHSYTKILYWSRCAVSMAIIAILTDSIDLYATSVAVASLIVRYFKHVGCQNYLQLLNYPFFCFWAYYGGRPWSSRSELILKRKIIA